MNDVDTLLLCKGWKKALWCRLREMWELKEVLTSAPAPGRKGQEGTSSRTLGQLVAQ